MTAAQFSAQLLSPDVVPVEHSSEEHTRREPGSSNSIEKPQKHTIQKEHTIPKLHKKHTVQKAKEWGQDSDSSKRG